MRICVVLVAACGSSPKTEAEKPKSDPEAEAAAAERKQLDADEPKSPYDVVAVHGFQTTAVCGQGPYRITVPAVGAKYSERVRVTICNTHEIVGDYRLTRGTEKSEVSAFGFPEWQDKYCLASDAKQVTEGSTTSASGNGSGGVSSAAAASAPPSAKPVDLEMVMANAAECPKGSATQVVNMTYISVEGPAIPPKTPLMLELWSSVPMHLDNAMILVTQTAPRQSMTVAEWADYRRRHDAWDERERAYSDRQVAAGRMKYIYQKPSSTEAPPPPRSETRPPIPSPHAEWIGGYWHHETTWSWIAGFWRVPDADITADVTTHAPVAPPPERAEDRSLQPAVVAVWTPGFWAWDGGGYIWISGSWRIPPPSGGRWITPSWRPRRTGVVFVPGGWRR